MLLCGVFGVLELVRSPKQTGATVDTAAAVQRNGVELRFTTDRDVAPVAAAVTIEPAAPFTVDSSAQDVTVTFDDPLRYGTDYTVRVTAAGGTSLEHSFTTASPDIYFLDQTAARDRILRTSFDGSAAAPVFTADHITDFVLAGTLIVAVTESPDGTSATTLVSTVDGLTEALRTPVPGIVDQLDSSPTSTRVGFRLTGEGTPGVLMLADLGRSRQAVPVAGPTGARLETTGWAFVHYGLELVAGTPAGDIVIADVLTRHAQLLAQRTVLTDVATDGLSITASGARGEQTFQLNGASGPPAPGAAPAATSPGAFARTSPRQALRGRTLETDGHTLAVDGRIIYTAAAGEQVVELSASANDQYAVLEVAPAGRAGERGVGRTVMVDVADGGTLDVPGVLLRWG